MADPLTRVLGYLDDPYRLNRDGNEDLMSAIAELSSPSNEGCPLVFDTPSVAATLSLIAAHLRSGNTKLVLISLNLLAWITSGCLVEHLSGDQQIYHSLDKCLQATSAALHSNNFDVVSMSLFIWSSYRLSYLPISLPIAAAVDIITSADRQEQLCASKAADYREQVKRKLVFWAYRALTKMAKMSKPSGALIVVKDFAVLLKDAFDSIIASCNDVNTTASLFPAKDAQTSISYALSPLQLDLLLQMPVAAEMAFLLQPSLDASPVVCATLRYEHGHHTL
jgi:hypothetical protein